MFPSLASFAGRPSSLRSQTKISLRERTQSFQAHSKNILEEDARVRPSASTTVGEVLSRKKAVLAAAKVTGSSIGHQKLLSLNAKDAPIAALMWRAMFAIDAPEKRFEVLSDDERVEVLRSGETNVKNCEWQAITGPVTDKTLAKYITKLTKLARAVLPGTMTRTTAQAS